MNDTEAKLRELDEKIERLKTRKRRLEAQRKKQSRKEETRRKILLGASVLKLMEDERWRQVLRPYVEAQLEREVDRKLFSEEWWRSRYGE